ncbi:transglycosylase SLT domain-containing protein [bacterium]|nr:transglycosylase SLT domain-containing protein [bacterium]MCI0602747.1 transglycosylase SLT domain-containing protein [bacterium]
MPKDYESNVRFWMKVYGEWEEDKMIIHDARNMDVVFEVVDVPDENEILRTAASVGLRAKVEKIKRILQELHNNPNAKSSSKDHQDIYELYKHIHETNKFRNASENVRIQQGIKERFELGLERMTIYLDEIKKVFRLEGLPEELSYLPLVESSFNNQAVSKTRAAGIWQFMPGTARLYMKVNNDLDERYDPMVATRGAARYLKRSHGMFGSWPLNLMSYNHGQQGVMNAVRTMGTSDFMTIINGYSGRYFGFASRNFYAEFLAACKVMHDSKKYFNDVDYGKPLRRDTIRLAKPLWVTTILNHSSISREELRVHNPALQSSVMYGKRPIPTGYDLHFPAGRYENVPDLITQLRTHEKPGQKKAPTLLAESKTPSTSKASTKSIVAKKTYVVRKGDTLYSISRKFSTSIELLRKINGLNHNNIHPGQRLFVSTR